jgi:hypothetical protein
VAVHAVDTLLANDKIFPTSHDFRNDVLFRTNRYAKINGAYQPLYTLSRTVRYFADPKKWIRIDDIRPKIIERYLYPLEQSVQKLANLDLGLAPIALASSPEK